MHTGVELEADDHPAALLRIERPAGHVVDAPREAAAARGELLLRISRRLQKEPRPQPAVLEVGFGRIVALHCHSSALYQIH